MSNGVGRRFVLVDPATGSREPAFDHARLADRLIAADKDSELLIVPGAEHTFIDSLADVRKRCWDFLVRELIGTQPPAYRPAPIAVDLELLGELFA